MVIISTKSVKPFMIYSKIKNLTLKIDLLTLGPRSTNYIFWTICFIDYMAKIWKKKFFFIICIFVLQFSTKSVTPFMIYSKSKNLTVKIDLWPWGQGQQIIFLWTICFIEYMMKIWTKSVQQCCSWFIAKLIILPWKLTFDLEAKVNKWLFFEYLFYWLYGKNFNKIGQAVHDL